MYHLNMNNSYQINCPDKKYTKSTEPTEPTESNESDQNKTVIEFDDDSSLLELLIYFLF